MLEMFKEAPTVTIPLKEYRELITDKTIAETNLEHLEDMVDKLKTDLADAYSACSIKDNKIYELKKLLNGSQY